MRWYARLEDRTLFATDEVTRSLNHLLNGLSTASIPKQFGAMLFTRFRQRSSMSAWMHKLLLQDAQEGRKAKRLWWKHGIRP